MVPTRRTSFFVVCLLIAGGCTSPVGVRSPRQPTSGPGGADYVHAKAQAERHGEGSEEYWIFTPDDPRPAQAPFVVFLHGWGGWHPRSYGAWIQHTVRKGHIVVFPRYQLDWNTPPEEMHRASRAAIADAWKRLAQYGPITPAHDSVAWFGHSFGAVLASLNAATSDELDLPPPSALLLVEPGGHGRVELGDLSEMPNTPTIVLMTGADDDAFGSRGATAIVTALAHIPRSSLEVVEVQSDAHSTPPLVADHFAPLGAATRFPPADLDQPATGTDAFRQQLRRDRAEGYAVDALDYYGFWKLGDALLDAAFRSKNREYAIGNTPQQRFMGFHLDGTAVNELRVATPDR